LKEPAIRSKLGSEVESRSPDHLIQFQDDVLVKIMVADGQGSDLVLELLQGLVAHAPGTRRQEKAEKLIAFPAKRCDPGFLPVQPKLKAPTQHVLDECQSLLRLRGGPGQDDEIVGVSDEVKPRPIEFSIQLIEDDVGEQR